jgi:(p)ppGpp synthase/HD superfamily hydrolase
LSSTSLQNFKSVLAFAEQSHGDQKRKYTDEPYLKHLKEVAQLLISVGASEETISAGILHDTLEDTDASVTAIRERFGEKVAELVIEVSDVSEISDGNRSHRKKLDREHLSKASRQGQSIKLADIISNTPSIVYYDANFAKIYVSEAKLLLGVLTNGDEELWNIADKLIADAE